ncbi:MAG: sensor histidine kinase [Eubacterium sp.]|jgi:signal transduction histidine kinase|nr:sensor histidine kinase [Eubacterium sp.]
MRNVRQRYFKLLMIFINLISVLFVTVFIYYTTKKICNSFIAREFLDNVNALPWRPSTIIIEVLGLFGLLVVSFALREIFHPNNNKVIYVSLIAEFIIIIMIVYFLNFNYNGILFLFFADIITYAKGSKERYLVVLLAIGSFLLADYELISINYKLYSINDYIGYYNSMTQQYLLGFYNVMISVNIIMFIVYCVYVIQEQRGTIDEVNMLYKKLSEANEDLQNANNQLQIYATVTEKMGETKERNRLAREIHDTLGHTLTGISAGIDACIATVEKSPEGTKKQLEIISKVTREGISDIRRSVNQLRPDALEHLSLEYAITKMIMDINSVTNTKVFFQSEVKVLKFDHDEENAIYRVIQESLTNAIRHGKATKIWIKMRKEFSEILLTIQDNGTGCETFKQGFGTRHIMERIEMLNGTVKFENSDGFVVSAKIPIRWGEEYD